MRYSENDFIFAGISALKPLKSMTNCLYYYVWTYILTVLFFCPVTAVRKDPNITTTRYLWIEFRLLQCYPVAF